MNKRVMMSALALTALLGAGTNGQEKTVMVGGAAMYPSKNIIENAMNSADHTTLVTAVKAAGLVDTLKGKGPFTVFAPTNAAFAKLPAGTVEMLLQPDHKKMLTEVLTYHVVAGRMDSAGLMAKAKSARGGKFDVKTVEGDKLWIVLKDGKLWLQDEKGNTATITTADVYQSNGVIHVIDTVVMPG